MKTILTNKPCAASARLSYEVSCEVKEHHSALLNWHPVPAVYPGEDGQAWTYQGTEHQRSCAHEHLDPCLHRDPSGPWSKKKGGGVRGFSLGRAPIDALLNRSFFVLGPDGFHRVFCG